MSKRALAAALFLLSVTCGPVRADSVQDLQQLVRQGQFDQLVERVTPMLANRPNDVQLRFLKGIALSELHRSAEAITIFQKLTEEHPELPEPFNNLGVLYAQQRQYDKARTTFETAVRNHPGYARAYENLGDVYLRLAGEAYDKTRTLDTANPAIQRKLAMIRDATGFAPAEASAGSGTPTSKTPQKTLPAAR